MKKQVYSVGGHMYPVLRHVEGFPVLDIPLLNDNRWKELSGRYGCELPSHRA